MKNPVVDIYLPTYKPQPDYLRAAIRSILGQTEHRWRLWVNDQSTTIPTQEIVSEFLQDERISFHCNDRHPGIGGNWNDCLQYGTAPIVQYMFQDDVWTPQYLATGLRIMEEHPDVGMVSLGHQYIFEGDIPTEHLYNDLVEFLAEKVQPGHHHGQDFLLWWMRCGLHPNVIGEPMFVMLRRSIMEQTGKFREDMQQNLDSEYWARMLTETNWYFRPGNFGSFRVHFDGASQRNYRAGKGMFDRYRMLRDIAARLPPKIQPEARKILSQQLALMGGKFVERYAGQKVEDASITSLMQLIWRHPVAVILAIAHFAFRR